MSVFQTGENFKKFMGNAYYENIYMYFKHFAPKLFLLASIFQKKINIASFPMFWCILNISKYSVQVEIKLWDCYLLEKAI